jgi:hypothetical protein
MKTRQIIGALAAALTITAQAHADSTTAPVTHTPGYDRPDTQTQQEPDGHAKVVYFTTFFEQTSQDIQSLADATSTDDFKPNKVKRFRHTN